MCIRDSSTELLGQLHLATRTVVRRHKKRSLHPKSHTQPFGGINTIVLGDMWQLQPPSGSPLWAKLSHVASRHAHAGGTLWWKKLQHCWELHGSVRCKNTWFNEVLQQCREGNLSDETYQYLHGFPTGTPTCYSSDAPETPCPCLQYLWPQDTAQNELVQTYLPQSPSDGAEEIQLYVPWVQRFLHEGATGSDLLVSECDGCRATREKRNRVLNTVTTGQSDIEGKPWDTAPTLYARNLPNNDAVFSHVVLLRARVFARINHQPLHWTCAEDTPLHADDRNLPLSLIHI